MSKTTTADEESAGEKLTEREGSADFAVLPRGGASEVGRSAYEVSVGDKTYLVDFGLGQTNPVSYPSFQQLKRESIDGVFVTHAHIDHTGSLPLLERGGYLKPEAKIYATQPTATLSDVLLYDSLKLHKMGVRDGDHEKRYDEEDVAAVLERFEPCEYGVGQVGDLVFKFGDAAHLLGSAWLALQYEGRRIVFSGDIGGRSAHLKDVETPPEADTLFLESTYGDRDTHPSFSNARTELYQTAMTAAQNGEPVLIPTFGVGRAQEILQIFRERLQSEPDEVLDEISVVYDGMVTQTMERYHVYVDERFMDESLVNYRLNSHDPRPLLPEMAHQPAQMEDRQELFKQEETPIIVAPHGMLEGGFSAFYLHRMAMDVDDARLLFIGYQAEGTVGREIQDAEEGTVDVQVSAPMEPEFADSASGDEFGFHSRTVTVPTSWVETIDGFSGHAAANTLLDFAREVDPETIQLIHGNPRTISEFAEHLEENTGASASGAREGVIYPVEWTGEKELLEVADEVMGDRPTVHDTGEVPAPAKEESPFDTIEEDRIREIVEEEMEKQQ